MSELTKSVARDFLQCNISTEDASESMMVEEDELTTIYRNYLYDKQLSTNHEELLDKYIDIICNL